MLFYVILFLCLFIFCKLVNPATRGRHPEPVLAMAPVQDLTLAREHVYTSTKQMFRDKVLRTSKYQRAQTIL